MVISEAVGCAHRTDAWAPAESINFGPATPAIRTCPAKKDAGYVYPTTTEFSRRVGRGRGCGPRGVEPGPLAALFAIDESGVGENFQVVAHGGLGQADGFGQVTRRSVRQPTGSGPAVAGGRAQPQL